MNSLSRISNLFDIPMNSFFDLPLYCGFEDKKKWSPAMNISETDTEFLIQAEVPGIPVENIDLSVKDNILTIKGTKACEIEKDGPDGKRHLIERSYGSFVRSVRLPSIVDTEKLSARSKDGILDIRIGKRDIPKRIQIDIKS